MAGVDSQILDLHRQGLVTGAIAIKLRVESSYVRQVVRTHLEIAEAAKPSYTKERHKRRALEAKVDKAQREFEKAKAALADTD